jgi:hypothetical protein
MSESVAVITKVNEGLANEHWEVATPNTTTTFWRVRNAETGATSVYELGSTYGWNTLNEAVRYLQSSEQEATEAYGFKRGDKVLTVDSERCEILAFQAGGEIVWLHEVGADATRTMGHITSALLPAE